MYEMLIQVFFIHMGNELEQFTFLFSVIVEVFKQTDADYLNEEKGQQKDAGSTATTALLLGDRLLVANVGDSRVVACRAGSG